MSDKGYIDERTGLWSGPIAGVNAPRVEGEEEPIPEEPMTPEMLMKNALTDIIKMARAEPVEVSGSYFRQFSLEEIATTAEYALDVASEQI